MPPTLYDPRYGLSPALQTAVNLGTLRESANGGDLHTWDDVLANDSVIASLTSDEAKTNYLHGAYGLQSDFKVKNGKVVDARGQLARNLGWIVPAAMVGGSYLATLGGGGGTAAAGGVLPSSQAAGAGGLMTAPTVAAVGPAAATSATGGGGMGFFSSVGKFFNNPAAQVGTKVVGDLVSNRMQTGANNRATDAQAQAAREALDFEKTVYANDLRDYEGLRQMGDQANVRLGTLLNQSRQPVTASSIMNAGGGAPMPQGTASIGQLRGGQTPDAARMGMPGAPVPGGAVGDAPGMVRMQDPTTGEIRAVRPEAVAKYEARGARRVA